MLLHLVFFSPFKTCQRATPQTFLKSHHGSGVASGQLEAGINVKSVVKQS